MAEWVIRQADVSVSMPWPKQWEGVLVHPEQTVSQMVKEVLERQAKSLADSTGETFERAMSATLKTDAARQLRELAESPYSALLAKAKTGLPLFFLGEIAGCATGSPRPSFSAHL